MYKIRSCNKQTNKQTKKKTKKTKKKMPQRNCLEQSQNTLFVTEKTL